MKASLADSATHIIYMHRPLTFSRLLDVGIGGCLLVTAASVIYGHLHARESGLSPIHNYITEYMKMAPHWPWLIVASFAFAVLLFLLAMSFLMFTGIRPLTVIGALLLSAASMATFYTAYAPMRNVEQPLTPTYQWWTPVWWFTSQTARTPYEEGLADAYADVHYRAIRLMTVMSLTGMFLIAAGCFQSLPQRRFAWTTWTAVLTMSVLFLMGDHLTTNRGLWQRLGFAIMFGWFYLARAHCRSLALAPGAKKPTAGWTGDCS